MHDTEHFEQINLYYIFILVNANIDYLLLFLHLTILMETSKVYFMLKKPYIKWIAIVMLIAVFACNDSSFCLSNQHAIQASFYAATGDTDKDTTLTGIYIWGLENDSLFHDSASVHEMYLTANLNYDSTQFIIREEKLVGDNVIGENDTLQFLYKRDLQYVSGDCGMAFNLILDTVIYTTNIIDSVRISYANVNYGENIENVKIYIEP